MPFLHTTYKSSCSFSERLLLRLRVRRIYQNYFFAHFFRILYSILAPFRYSVPYYQCHIANLNELLVSFSRKRVEPIRFRSAYFPIYFADFFLNIRIFFKKIGSSMKKSAASKLLRTIRRINFRLILSDFDEVKCGLY